MTDHNVEWTDDQARLQEIIDTMPVVVVTFTAPAWCNPCVQFKPHFEEASLRADAAFVSVDVDDTPWSREFGVLSVPTVALFVNGERQDDIKGRTVVQLLAEIPATS